MNNTNNVFIQQRADILLLIVNIFMILSKLSDSDLAFSTRLRVRVKAPIFLKMGRLGEKYYRISVYFSFCFVNFHENLRFNGEKSLPAYDHVRSFGDQLSPIVEIDELSCHRRSRPLMSPITRHDFLWPLCTGFGFRTIWILQACT